MSAEFNFLSLSLFGFSLFGFSLSTFLCLHVVMDAFESGTRASPPANAAVARVLSSRACQWVS